MKYVRIKKTFIIRTATAMMLLCQHIRRYVKEQLKKKVLTFNFFLLRSYYNKFFEITYI